jgi:hypothetical protein
MLVSKKETEIQIGQQGIALEFLQEAEDEFVKIADKREGMCNMNLKRLTLYGCYQNL